MTDAAERMTPLHAAHVAAGARMTPFAGWSMPLQYEGILAEHLQVRRSAGCFDVSHMGQLRVRGAERIEALQRMVSNDLRRIPEPGDAQYTLLFGDGGGIEDDLIAYRIAEDELLLVVNAANREHDAALLAGIADDESDEWAMLALQGPLALDVLAERAGVDVREVAAFRFVDADIAGHRGMVATTGYTGEAGCEVLVPAAGAQDAWELLTADERVQPCGLGARDTLRLEACFPLHGNDLGTATDPIGAGLGFAAPASVAADGRGGAGHDAIDRIRASGPARRLVPLLAEGRGIPRAGASVSRPDGEVVGVVSSGTMSPVLRTGIALAWIDAADAVVDAAVSIDVRGTAVPARIVRRPFVARGSLR